VAIAATPPGTPNNKRNGDSDQATAAHHWLTTATSFSSFAILQMLLVLGYATLYGVIPMIVEVWLTLYVLVAAFTTLLCATVRAARGLKLKVPKGYEMYLLLQLALVDLLLFHSAWIVSVTSAEDRVTMRSSITLIHPTYEDRQAIINLEALLGTVLVLFTTLLFTIMQP
jgi:hypothetical protein